MRVFVLCTGRCGSLTFAKACSHITNYTSAHESGRYVDWSYPDRHIEVDNRLVWFAGELARRHQNEFFVELHRNSDAVVESYMRRPNSPLLQAYRSGICQVEFETDQKLVHHLVQTLRENINLVMRDMACLGAEVHSVQLERVDRDFPVFWDAIGAEGDLDAALREFGKRYNKGA